MKYPFLREETVNGKNQVTFTGDELDIYLPENYLEEGSAFARELGNDIETIGLFWFSVGGKKYELKLPIKMQFEFSSRKKFKGRLAPGIPSGAYDVFVLNKGDAFVCDTSHAQGIADLETMIIRILDAGRMPASVSYPEVIAILYNLLKSSGVGGKLGVSSAVFEILVSEIYRSRNDPTKPFRFEAGKQGTSDYDFRVVRLNRVPELNSTFSSIMGEDLFTEIDNIIVRNRTGVKDRPAGLEKLMKY